MDHRHDATVRMISNHCMYVAAVVASCNRRSWGTAAVVQIRLYQVERVHWQVDLIAMQLLSHPKDESYPTAESSNCQAIQPLSHPKLPKGAAK